MCDTYIPIVGYICFECQKEFKKWCDGKQIDTESEITDALKEFMYTPKPSSLSKDKLSIEEYFEKHSH